MLTSVCILIRIAKIDFNHNYNEWIADIVRENRREEDKAKVLRMMS